jgi:hypothetical protein
MRFFQQLKSESCMLQPKRSYFIMTIIVLVVISWLTLASINDKYDYLSNIINVKENGVSTTAQIVDVKSWTNYAHAPYTIYKYTIITNKKTNTVTLNHKYQLGRTISIIEKSPSNVIEGTKNMSTWDLYQLNYQQNSPSWDLFFLIVTCSGCLWGVIKFFTYNWWL